MTEETQEKEPVHFNRGTVWGKVDGVPTRKLSKEGKGRPYLRIKVLCPSHRGNTHAYGMIWSKGKPVMTSKGPVYDESNMQGLLDYLKKNSDAVIKFVGFFNQYDESVTEDGKTTTVRRSNYTWYEWRPDKSDDLRASFSLVGVVAAKEGNILSLHLEREGVAPEDFKVYAREDVSLERLADGAVVQVKGYLQSREGEDEFGDTDNSPILPYFDDKDLKIRKQKIPF